MVDIPPDRDWRHMRDLSPPVNDMKLHSIILLIIVHDLPLSLLILLVIVHHPDHCRR